MSSAIPFRSLFSSALAGTLLCIRPESSLAVDAESLVFETHKTVFENEIVRLDYNLLYPVTGCDKQTVTAFQQQLLKDCFPSHQATTEEIGDTSLAHQPIETGNPASFIKDRVDFYQKYRKAILADRRDVQQIAAIQHSHQSSIPAVSVSSKLIAWKSNHWSYTGGAHGNGYTIARMLDTSTNELISPPELWEPESEPAIRRAVIRGLLRAQDLPASAKFGDLPVYCKPDEISLTNAFANSKGLTFIYSPYEIGPYSEGYFISEVPWREIIPHVKPKWRSLATVGWRTVTSKANR